MTTLEIVLVGLVIILLAILIGVGFAMIFLLRRVIFLIAQITAIAAIADKMFGSVKDKILSSRGVKD